MWSKLRSARLRAKCLGNPSKPFSGNCGSSLNGSVHVSLRPPVWKKPRRSYAPHSGTCLYKPAFPEGEEYRGRASAHARAMWHHLGWRTDQIPLLPHQMRETIAAEWFSCGWQEFFDLVEFTG